MATPKHSSGQDEAGFANKLLQPLERRSFLRYAGVTACATGLVLAGCDNDDDDDMPGTNANLLDVGTGDTGVLNYAYALEQLEAAFYARVKQGAFYTSASASEKAVFDDLAAHELIHREFFKAALGTNAIKSLEPDFSSINFGDRTSVMNAARSFEDLGVAAYNGAGQFLTSPDFLALAGKIVSVEARHAALIRDMINYNSFVATDVVDLSTGLERSKTPAEVLTVANTFLMAGSKLSANSLR